tara:strand:- start:578 stop:1354 length:777 start_codon:yes stop_codon:yes gene_type:complete
MNYKVSICLPAIRTNLWENFYNSIIPSVENYSWELIMVGPNDPPPFFSSKKNFKFLKDYGSPARCIQIATSLAEGELMMWGSDDGIFKKAAIASCIEKHEKLNYKDVIALKFTEGKNHMGGPMPKNYWMAHQHHTLRVVPEDFKIMMIGMFKLKYFRDLGGFDCKFEQVNMNTHDLSFRVQRDGGKIYESDIYVSTHDFQQPDHKEMNNAFQENDYPLWQEMYKLAPNFTYNERPIKIDYENWKDSPKIWQRRFGDMK